MNFFTWSYANNLYFTSNDGINGYELWVSDGTEAGTVIRRDINVGASNSSPDGMRIINGKLIFSARTSAAGTELWVDDGSQVTMLPEIYDGNNTGFLGFGFKFATVINSSK